MFWIGIENKYGEGFGGIEDVTESVWNEMRSDYATDSGSEYKVNFYDGMILVDHFYTDDENIINCF